jgi:tetratricopeptide (TPR) repeat protein
MRECCGPAQGGIEVIKKRVFEVAAAIIVILEMSATLFAEHPSIFSADVKLAPEDNPACLKQALGYFNSGDLKKAARSAAKSCSDRDYQRDGHKIYFLTGLAAELMGDRRQAAAAFSKSLSLRAGNSDALSFLGYDALERGETPAALNYFEEALWFSRFLLLNRADAAFQVGRLYLDRKDSVNAEKYFQQALSGTVHVAAAAALADLYLRDDRREAATKLLRSCAEKLPDSQELQRHLAAALLHGADRRYNKDNFSEAQTISRAVFQAQPNRPEKYSHPIFPILLRALIGTGEIEQAQQEIKMGLQLLPQNEELRRIAAQLEVEIKAKDLAAAPSLPDALNSP